MKALLYPRQRGNNATMSALRDVFRRYISIHGPLLAKGLSFTALFASIPLLFFLTVAGSLFLTPEVRGILEAQLLITLPATYRSSIMSGLERFASRPGSLSFVTIGVFLFSVHNLFFDVHRVVRAGLGLPVSPGRGRLRAIGLNAVFLLIIYATALVTLAAQVGAPYIPLPNAIVQLIARMGVILVLAATLGSVVRVAAGTPIPHRIGIPVFLGAAVLWQGATFISGFIVRGTGRRVVVYGVLASAILFLLLMRVFAEIILHTALWIHYFLHHRRDANEPRQSRRTPARR